MTAQNLCRDPLFTNFPSHKTSTHITIPYFSATHNPPIPISFHTFVYSLCDMLLRWWWCFLAFHWRRIYIYTNAHTKKSPFGNDRLWCARSNRPVLLYDYEICIHNIIARNNSTLTARPSGFPLRDATSHTHTNTRFWLTIVDDDYDDDDETAMACTNNIYIVIQEECLHWIRLTPHLCATNSWTTELRRPRGGSRSRVPCGIHMMRPMVYTKTDSMC